VRPLCSNVHSLLRVLVCEEWCLGVIMSVIGRSWLPGCMGGFGGGCMWYGREGGCVAYIHLVGGCTCVVF
jgi:hypothetical protein